LGLKQAQIDRRAYTLINDELAGAQKPGLNRMRQLESASLVWRRSNHAAQAAIRTWRNAFEKGPSPDLVVLAADGQESYSSMIALLGFFSSSLGGAIAAWDPCPEVFHYGYI